MPVATVTQEEGAKDAAERPGGWTEFENRDTLRNREEGKNVVGFKKVMAGLEAYNVVRCCTVRHGNYIEERKKCNKSNGFDSTEAGKKR